MWKLGTSLRKVCLGVGRLQTRAGLETEGPALSEVGDQDPVLWAAETHPNLEIHPENSQQGNSFVTMGTRTFIRLGRQAFPCVRISRDGVLASKPSVHPLSLHPPPSVEQLVLL